MELFLFKFCTKSFLQLGGKCIHKERIIMSIYSLPRKWIMSVREKIFNLTTFYLSNLDVIFLKYFCCFSVYWNFARSFCTIIISAIGVFSYTLSGCWKRSRRQHWGRRLQRPWWRSRSWARKSTHPPIFVCQKPPSKWSSQTYLTSKVRQVSILKTVQWTKSFICSILLFVCKIWPDWNDRKKWVHKKYFDVLKLSQQSISKTQLLFLKVTPFKVYTKFLKSANKIKVYKSW